MQVTGLSIKSPRRDGSGRGLFCLETRLMENDLESELGTSKYNNTDGDADIRAPDS